MSCPLGTSILAPINVLGIRKRCTRDLFSNDALTY